MSKITCAYKRATGDSKGPDFMAQRLTRKQMNSLINN